MLRTFPVDITSCPEDSSVTSGPYFPCCCFFLYNLNIYNPAIAKRMVTRDAPMPIPAMIAVLLVSVLSWVDGSDVVVVIGCMGDPGDMIELLF